MSFGIPSWSDIKNAAARTASTATSTLTSAAGTVRDLGSAAVDRTRQLASDGVDLGRRAVNAVRSIDVREAASVVREKISEGTEAARDGIKTGVEWTGRQTHEAAEFARDHVPGGDNIVPNAVRGAITAQEDMTRFSLGVVGGVSREVVGLAGTVGELGTTVAEMQLSPEASREYGQRILDGARGAAEATGNYVEGVADDPSRVGSDISGAAGAVKEWGGGQIDRYEQAFRAGEGFETVGMDVGTVATYVVPVGGGPARGALTAAARGGTEAIARGGAQVVARGGAEVVARGGAEAAARSGAEVASRGGVDATRAAEGAGAVVRTAEQMAATLRGTTRAELDRLRTVEGMSNKKIGPAISTVMDNRTGTVSKTYSNHALGEMPANLNPVLAERLGAAKAKGYIATHGVASHAEVYAANELLNAGSRLEDIVIYTEQVGGARAGTVKPPCPHCSTLLEGADYVR